MMKVFFEKDLRLHQLCNATQQPRFRGALVVVPYSSTAYNPAQRFLYHRVRNLPAKRKKETFLKKKEFLHPMIKKGMIALLTLAVLVLIAACTQQGTLPVPDTSGDTQMETSSEDNVTAIESNIEYCKMILKTLQVKVNTFERQEKTILSNIDVSKERLADLKAKDSDPDKIQEEQQDLDDLNARLKNARSELAKAKKELTTANTKCSTLAKKADKTICNEFKDDIQEQTKNAQDALAKEEANLENIKKQYDAAKAAAKSSQFLDSIDEEKEKKNLDILKVKNTIDKLGQMLQQLDERCK